MAQRPQKGFLDGIVNPSQFYIFGSVFPVIFAGFVPVTSYLTQPGGLVEKAVQTTIRLLVPGGDSVVPTRTIPALAGIYVFVTFAMTGAWSVAGQAGSNPKGLNNNHPRQHVNDLRGLPLRLRSAHYNLLEMFGGWAITAALAQTLAPSDAHIRNLLGLHVLAKVFLYYPSYILNVAPTRSFGHLLATSSVVNVCLRLAVGA